ncbi:YbaN family protein [Pigmentiphaga humi]|nr:YbaN family protein [Pigmentiphaga humi]
MTPPPRPDPTSAEFRSPPGPLMRMLMYAAALLCLALGVIGIFVPGLPTTVFILMAAWLAARSSPRLQAWLENHPLFGSMIRNWRKEGTVSRKAKWSATITMALCAAILFIVPAPAWAAWLSCAAMGGVAVWLWMRPEPTAEETAQG